MERQNLLFQNFKLEFNNYTFDLNVSWKFWYAESWKNL